MSTAVFAFVIALISVPGFAGEMDESQRCSTSCSSQNHEPVPRALSLAQAVLDGSSGHRSNEIVNACTTRFGTGSAGMDCAKAARSGEIVTACANRFGTGSAGMECVKTDR